MKTINFKKAVEVLGYTPVKVTKGYNFRTIWAKDTEGQLWYFHIEDLRDSMPIMYKRKVKDLQDYTGESNHIIYDEDFEELGYKVVEPRQKCDYNSM